MWGAALLFGLLGSFHCVGMCGPIAFLLPVDRTNTWRKSIQIGLYHVGRLISYGIIGLLFGLLGKSFSLFGLQQQLSIVIGVLMILAAVFPKKWMAKMSVSKPIFIGISRIKSSLGQQLKKKTPDTFFTIGFLNGFLPCGLVYLAVFTAIVSGSVLEGGLYMVLFGIGTIPLMTTAIYLGNLITGVVKTRIRKAIPIVIVLFGFLFILRGLGLGISFISPKPMVAQVEAKYECH
ncbi:sulfite exporter TauE/SafE family protein [Rasiella sp. SM2506]|uniref:sulfite exporter TauE/SafE family protein n=1 Tax=Rasiella sp. SM2506 TaxID=3423914 RepID=UPI003D7A9C50